MPRDARAKIHGAMTGFGQGGAISSAMHKRTELHVNVHQVEIEDQGMNSTFHVDTQKILTFVSKALESSITIEHIGTNQLA